MSDKNDPNVTPPSDDPAYVAVWDQYIKLKNLNSKTEMDLRTKYGPQAVLGRADGIEARMELILDTICPVNSQQRIELELEWQRLLEKSFANLRNAILEAIREQRQAEKEARRNGAPDQQVQQTDQGPVLWTPPGAKNELIVP